MICQTGNGPKTGPAQNTEKLEAEKNVRLLSCPELKELIEQRQRLRSETEQARVATEQRRAAEAARRPQRDREPYGFD